MQCCTHTWEGRCSNKGVFAFRNFQSRYAHGHYCRKHVMMSVNTGTGEAIRRKQYKRKQDK